MGSEARSCYYSKYARLVPFVTDPTWPMSHMSRCHTLRSHISVVYLVQPSPCSGSYAILTLVFKVSTAFTKPCLPLLSTFISIVIAVTIIIVTVVIVHHVSNKDILLPPHFDMQGLVPLLSPALIRGADHCHCCHQAHHHHHHHHQHYCYSVITSLLL